MEFENIRKLAKYTGQLPKLLSIVAQDNPTKAIELLDEWAHGKRDLEEIFNEAVGFKQ